MSDITSIEVKINNVTVPLTTIRLEEIETFNRETASRLYFTRPAVLPEADTWQNKTVRVDINGEIAFWGRITGRPRVHDDGTGWSYAYEARSRSTPIPPIRVTIRPTTA